MSLDLTLQEADEISAEAEQYCPPTTSIDHIETIYIEPTQLGSGYSRVIELCPGLDLCIMDIASYDLTVRMPENKHLIQFLAFLSGLYDCGNYLQVSAKYSYIGGSGVQPSHSVLMPKAHPQVGVDIHMTPALFQQFFANAHGELPASLQPLVQENDWQRRFSPRMTGAIRTVVRQMINCPFLGATKQAYLQGKVFELIALQLDSIADSTAASTSHTLKSDTVTRIHYAAEILRSHFETPPNQTTLAQQVGLSDRTLQKGFKAVFGMTPFAYLSQQRMYQARQLLLQADYTVAEVANMVGYANPAQFAAAFKRQFGMTPSDCGGSR